MIDKEKIKLLTKEFLVAIGDDPSREGLLDTPRRVADMCEELFMPQKIKRTAFSSDNFNGLVIVKNIDFSSVCEHHLLPFFGKVCIGYIPNKKVLGLSKLARIVELHSKKPQLQERLCKEILDDVVSAVSPKGAIVKIDAVHTCMSIRGVKKDSSSTTTILGYGELDEKQNMANFLLAIKD